MIAVSTKLLVVFSGLPGTGKSTLAEAVAIAIGAPVYSVDPIEAAIVASGMARSFETGLAAYLVAEVLASGQLARGGTAIVDAVNAVEHAKSMWTELAAKHNARLRVIECACSDAAVHCSRLAVRARPFGLEPSWDDVLARAGESTSWDVPVCHVDAITPIETNVTAVLAWIAAP